MPAAGGPPHPGTGSGQVRCAAADRPDRGSQRLGQDPVRQAKVSRRSGAASASGRVAAEPRRTDLRGHRTGAAVRSSGVGSRAAPQEPSSRSGMVSRAARRTGHGSRRGDVQIAGTGNPAADSPPAPRLSTVPVNGWPFAGQHLERGWSCRRRCARRDRCDRPAARAGTPRTAGSERRREAPGRWVVIMAGVCSLSKKAKTAADTLTPPAGHL